MKLKGIDLEVLLVQDNSSTHRGEYVILYFNGKPFGLVKDFSLRPFDATAHPYLYEVNFTRTLLPDSVQRVSEEDFEEFLKQNRTVGTDIESSIA